MQTAFDCYRDAALPSPLIGFASGRLPPPLGIWTTPPGWYDFPPALLPIWSDGSSPSLVGLWKHWFVRREPVFVKFLVEAKLALETARTSEQFYVAVAINVLVANEGVGPELEAFATQVGLNDLAGLDAVAVETGDDPVGFPAFDCFKTRTPLRSVRDATVYDGDFPVGATRNLDTACWFELDEAVQDAGGPAGGPPWLDRGANKPALFDRLLAAGDLGGAWLTLNSTGWTIRQARDAIAALDRAAGDPAFSRLTAAWLAVSGAGDLDSSGY